MNNVRVLRYLKKMDINNESRDIWFQHWIQLGLVSLEKLLSHDPRVGRFAYGDEPGLIDICLVPQLFNALGSQMDISPYPTLLRIFNECMQLPTFIDASWEKQIDSEGSNPAIPPQEKGEGH
jgi:maleylacetoacetate isomerase/maleylpyruvate isomerase